MVLDTSIVVACMRGIQPEISEILSAAEELYLPATALGELYYGIECSENDPRALSQLQSFLEKVIVLYSDEETAKKYGVFKRYLSQIGKAIPEGDIWIAATASAYRMPLFCRDLHFKNLVAHVELIWPPGFS
jgi:tRNA(fMet)-specific endonuclease VapC